MSRTTGRRLTRLEKLAVPVIAEQRRREAEDAIWRRQAARDHATKLVTLILHGNPQVEEPLGIAWRRALDRLGLTGSPQAVLPDLLRARVVADLPGDTENAKFAQVFGSAPRWLLSFCIAWADCRLLGFDLPKSSEPLPEAGRDGLRETFDSWPELPTGTLGAGGATLKAESVDRLRSEERHDLIRLFKTREENWSRHERRRCREILAKIDANE
jgi:hypothetical protein